MHHFLPAFDGRGEKNEGYKLPLMIQGFGFQAFRREEDLRIKREQSEQCEIPDIPEISNRAAMKSI